MLSPRKKTAKALHKNRGQVLTEPESGLPGLIRLANMIPPDVPMPDFSATSLDTRQPDFERFLDRNFPRHKYPECRSFLDDGLGKPNGPDQMYEFIKETRAILKMIAMRKREQSFLTLTFHFPWHLVGEWQVDRIRVCDTCQKIFFANRNNKLTCSKTCSTARRVREWRKHQAQYEQARQRKSDNLGRKLGLQRGAKKTI